MGGHALGREVVQEARWSCSGAH